MFKNIAIGSDHAGYEYKRNLIEALAKKGFTVEDFGTFSEESTDYPIYAGKVCDAVTSGKCDCGILICGTGIGMSIAANKHRGIRAAVCSDDFSTEMTRAHNDANVLCMGARVLDYEAILRLTDIFLKTEFIGGKHLRRIQMLE